MAVFVEPQALVTPQDNARWAALRKALEGQPTPPSFPVDDRVLMMAKQRVALASKVSMGASCPARRCVCLGVQTRRARGCCWAGECHHVLLASMQWHTSFRTSTTCCSSAIFLRCYIKGSPDYVLCVLGNLTQIDSIQRKDRKRHADSTWARSNADALGIQLSDDADDEGLADLQHGAIKASAAATGGKRGKKRKQDALAAAAAGLDTDSQASFLW